MLLSSTSNRAKSWSCEHCANWLEQHSLDVCKSCYWAYPEDYAHVAMQDMRRLDIIWQGKEVKDFDKLKELSEQENTKLPDFVKATLKKSLK